MKNLHLAPPSDAKSSIKALLLKSDKIADAMKKQLRDRIKSSNIKALKKVCHLFSLMWALC